MKKCEDIIKAQELAKTSTDSSTVDLNDGLKVKIINKENELSNNLAIQ